MTLALDVVTEDPRLTTIDRQQCRQHVQHRGLARAVRAEHPEDLAFHDREVDIVHRAVRAKSLSQTAGFDSRDGRTEVVAAVRISSGDSQKGLHRDPFLLARFRAQSSFSPSASS